MKKKIISLFLAVVMVFSMVPTYTVFAASNDCNHIFTEETLPDEDNVFWETHTNDEYYVGSKAFISAELPASCDEDGWHLEATESTGFCMVCGEFITEDDKTPVKATGHNWVLEDGTEPTCEEDGIEFYYCDNTNYRIDVELNPNTNLYIAKVVPYDCAKTDTVTKDKLGHSFTDYVSNDDATCLDNATETAACDNNCGKTDTREIENSALGHDYEEDVTPAKCTEGGYTTHTCARCGDEYTDSETPELGHNYIAVGTSDPSCINKGYTSYECSRCDDAKIDDIIDELGHDFQCTDTVPPTCTEAGYSVYTCSRCDESSEADYVDALDHDLITTVIQEATCANGGIQGITKVTCSRCEYVDYVYTDAPEHILDNPDVIEPTCTTSGIEKGICSICGEDAVVVTPPLGHDFVTEIVKVTCTTDGFTKKTCKRCGAEFITDFIEATGHTFNDEDYVVTKEATCTENAEETAPCANGCGKTDTREIENSALGHEYKDVVTPPTCTEDGYTTHTCVRGDDEYVDSIVPATGHEYEDVVTPPTCTEDGYTTHTCVRGDDKYVDSIVPATGHTFNDEDYVITKEATCTENAEETAPCANGCGVTDTREIENSALGHHIVLQRDSSYKPHCTTAGRNVYVCDRCGEYSFIEYLAPLGHLIDEETYIAQEADCLHGNRVDYDCCREVEEYNGDIWSCDEHISTEDDARDYSVEFTNNVNHTDGFYYVEGNNFDPNTDIVHTGHDYEWEYVPATCEFDAYWIGTCVRERDGIFCSDNGVDNSPVRVDCRNTAFGHDWALLDDNSAKQPTCTEDGYRHYMCLNDHSHTYTEKLPAMGHNFLLVDSIAATCVEGGYDLYECQNGDCEENYREYKTQALPHDWKVTDRIPATCTEAGYDVYTCDKCGLENNRTTTPAEGHNYVVTDSVAATCITQGYDIYTCTKCDDTYNKTTTSASGHQFVANGFTAPTCTTAGYTTYKCINSGCNETFNSNFISAKGHNYGKVEVVEATCTTPGYTTYTCTNDGCDVNYTTGITDIAEHVLKATSTEKATCTTDGSVTYECANCDYKFVEVLPAFGHNYGKVEVVEATCTTAGYTKYTCTNDGCDENYTTDITDIAEHVIKATSTEKATCTTDGSVTYECANCDYKFVEVLPAFGHNYGKVEVVEATCTTPGYTKYTCTNDGCDENYTTDITDIAEHVIKATSTEKATCTTDGSVTYECANCDYKFVEVLPAFGHNYGKVEVVEATCTTPGYTKYTCTNDGCDENYTTDITDIAEHVIKATSTEKATCTTDGSVTYECANCDYKFVEVLPAFGHNYGKVEVVEATCTASGYTKYTCTNDGCNENYTTDVTDIAEHIVSIIDTAAASCCEDGYIIYGCANCEYQQKTIIKATGHNYGKVEVLEATCTETGYTKYTCTNDGCDESYITDETAVNEHVVTLIDSLAPTCTEAGYKIYSCSNCTYQLKEDIPATGHCYGDAETHAATCINKKYTEIKCTTCGATVYYKSEGSLGGHKEVTTVTTKATTSKAGKLTTKCSVCNKTISTKTIPAIKSVTLSYTSVAYTGGSKKPSVKVVDKNGNKISNTYYTVKYTNNTAIGTATVTVTFKGRYSGTVKKTFKIVPKGVGISSLKTKNKTITIAYGKVSNASGYQIQYSTKSDFSSAKSLTVSSNKTTSATIKGLKANKKYYIRIRAYKVVSGTKYYGAWTKTSKTCK